MPTRSLEVFATVLKIRIIGPGAVAANASLPTPLNNKIDGFSVGSKLLRPHILSFYRLQPSSLT